jgi:hypothetical protein
MTNESRPLVPDTVIVTRNDVELITAADAARMSRPPVNVTLGVDATLKSKPFGAFRIKVTFVPTPMSFFFFSAIVIGPRVVHSGVAPSDAKSESNVDPPLAGVTFTAAPAGIWVKVRSTHRSAGSRYIAMERQSKEIPYLRLGN